MATKSVSARHADSAKPVLKTTARKAAAEKPKVVKSSAKSVLNAADAWVARDKKYSEIFGAVFPKGRVFGPDGNAVTVLAGAQLDMCLAQYAPRQDRMSWVYVTHGLSQSSGDKHSRVELVLHSRHRDAVAVNVLAQVARHIRESGNPLKTGDLIASSQIADAGFPLLPHWLVVVPDKSIPEQIAAPAGPFRFALLLGVSDAEMEVALKVNPEIADGRKVLFEALRAGGVYPVTDAKRTCLTRRRDFHRLWECAFRAVRAK